MYAAIYIYVYPSLSKKKQKQYIRTVVLYFYVTFFFRTKCSQWKIMRLLLLLLGVGKSKCLCRKSLVWLFSTEKNKLSSFSFLVVRSTSFVFDDLVSWKKEELASCWSKKLYGCTYQVVDTILGGIVQTTMAITMVFDSRNILVRYLHCTLYVSKSPFSYSPWK